MKYVHDLIRKNLKKVGIDSETEPEWKTTLNYILFLICSIFLFF